MRVCVLNFADGVDKTYVVEQLLAARLDAPVLRVLAPGAASARSGAAKPAGVHSPRRLHQQLLRTEAAVVDVDHTSTAEFIDDLASFEGSHWDIDLFVVPTGAAFDHQVGSIKTLKALRSLGVSGDRIRLLFMTDPGQADLEPGFDGVLTAASLARVPTQPPAVVTARAKPCTPKRPSDALPVSTQAVAAAPAGLGCLDALVKRQMDSAFVALTASLAVSC